MKTLSNDFPATEPESGFWYVRRFSENQLKLQLSKAIKDSQKILARVKSKIQIHILD